MIDALAAADQLLLSLLLTRETHSRPASVVVQSLGPYLCATEGLDLDQERWARVVHRVRAAAHAHLAAVASLRRPVPGTVVRAALSWIDETDLRRATS